MRLARGRADDPRRGKFFRAAEPLLERYGLRKTTVAEICRAAGASKRTFYELFRDKGDLYVQLVMELAAREVTAWEESLTEQLSARQRLEAYLDAYVEAGRRHPVFTLTLREPELNGLFAGCPKEEFFRPTLEALQRIIARGVAAGEFRPVDPRTVVWIIDALLDGIYYILPGLFGERGAYDDPALAAEARAFVIHGLLVKES